MIQIALVVILFSIALFYLGRKLYNEFSGRSGGCDNCGMQKSEPLK